METKKNVIEYKYCMWYLLNCKKFIQYLWNLSLFMIFIQTLELEHSLFDKYKYAKYLSRSLWLKKLYSREKKAKAHAYRYP